MQDDNLKGPPPVNANDTQPGDSTSPEYTAAISAPATGKDGKPILEARSVRDVSQMVGICTTAEMNNRSRAWRCKAVQDLHDMAPPRAFGDKLQQGQTWQTNLSTGSLSGLTQRVTQRLVQTITTAQTLTHSMLPESYSEWKDKSDLLQASMTELFREWDGFVPFVNMVATENVLQGYTLPLWLSPEDWKPQFFKQERVLIPEGSRMDVKELQWVVGKMDYPINEFCALFKDEDAAEKNGYQIKNCEIAATHAVVAQEGDDYLTTEPRRFSDLLNQGTWGIAYGNGGVRCVKCWLLASTEYDGAVTFSLIAREAPLEKALLRYSFKALPSMLDFAGLFSFEPGNGTVHSSKGLGRKLFNLCTVIEQSRCNMVDAAFMQNLIMLKGDAPARNRANMIVNAPFLHLPSAVELQQFKFGSTPADLAALDNLIAAWMEQAIGSYIADVANPSEEDPNKTATAKKIDYAREQESAAMALARWEDQFYGSISTNMQKRALSDANLSAAKEIFLKIVNDSTGKVERPSLYDKIEGTEAKAVEKIVQVLKKWPSDEVVDVDDNGEPQSPDEFLEDVLDEIRVWRDTSASVRANILKFTQAQNVAGMIAKYAGTPLGLNLDLEAMQMADVENTLGPVLAKKYIIPKGAETQQAEGKRAQMEEIATMLTLTAEVPVSPRDPHLVHAQACQEWLSQVAAPQLADPSAEQRFVVCTGHVLNHMGAHLQALEATPDGKTPEARELAKFHAGMSQQLGEVVSIRAHAREAAHLAAAKIIVDGEQSGGNVGQNGASDIESQSQPTPMPTATPAATIAPEPVMPGQATLPPTA